MVASNAELHSFICLPQFMNLSRKTALTMLTAVARCHLSAVIIINTKYIQIARALFTWEQDLIHTTQNEL